jgi:hypothetical protein
VTAPGCARALSAVGFAGALTSAAVAGADPLDQFGFGSAAAGVAGARTATATGPEAAHHNPAGVALADEPAVMLGWGYGAMRLRLDGRPADALDAHGTSLGLAVPIRVSPTLRLGAGLAMYLPDPFLARVQLLPLTEPSFVLLGSDPHRVVVEPVAGVAYADKLGFGLGASILADARSRQIVFDVGVVGGEKVGEAALDVELPLRAAPLLGLWLRPNPRVRAGLTWRGELSLDLALDIRANVEVAGVVTGDVLVSLRARNYFTPGRLTGGLAVDLAPSFTVAADLTWSRWSRFPPPPDLAVLLALDLRPPLVATDRPPADFDDTLDVRVGGEYRRPGTLALAARAGVAYRPSPVPAQVGLTSYADGDRLEVTAGAGLRVDGRPILTRPIELDLALQWQHLRGRLTVKDAGIAPGQAFSSGGDIVHLGVTSTVRL